jgi:hypothetical protein
MRALAREADKKARDDALAARNARMSQPEPLSPEFEFIVRMRNRCSEGISPAPQYKLDLELPYPCAETRQSSCRVLTERQLLIMGSSGFLLNILLKLSCPNHCSNAATKKMSSLILGRVTARHRTPEVCFICGIFAQ